jgi:hypothetical protein
MNVIAGGNGLRIGEELTFFYPSTEWDMDQGFSCFCGSKACLGYISGAKHMDAAQLEVRPQFLFAWNLILVLLRNFSG